MESLAKIETEPVGYVTLVGVARDLLGRAKWALPEDLVVDFVDQPDDLFHRLQRGERPLDAVVLGMGPEQAVLAAQRVNLEDKLIPVMILVPPGAGDELKRTLLFSPFLGNEVTVWSTDDIDILPSALREAAIRRRRRLRHRDTLSNAQIRLEKLPLQKPEATHYLDRLLDYAPVGVVTADLAGTIMTLNRRAQEILATGGRPLLGRPLRSVLPARERERLQALLEGCGGSEDSQGADVFEVDGPKGRVTHIEITIAPLAYRTGQKGFMLILQDVTQRVEAEEEMQHHVVVLRKFHGIVSADSLSLEEKLDEVLALGCDQFKLPVGLLSRIEGPYLDVVRSVGGASDYSVGRRYPVDQTYCGISITRPEPLAISHASREGMAQHPGCKAAGLEAYIGTMVRVGEGVAGTLCFLGRQPRARPFSSADRELLKLMSRWINTELQRERADAHMRKLSRALEQTGDIVVITDRDRFIEYVNPSFERVTGYRKAEVIGRKTHFLRSGYHDPAFYEHLKSVISAGRVYRGTITNKKRDGSPYYEQKTISPLKNDQGEITHYISTGHDITDLLEAQEKARAHQAELAHVARLSTLGEMTSGIAHELNQPLCAINTYAQGCMKILQRGDCQPEQMLYGLEQVVKQAELAGAIFRRLRDFARKSEMRREAIELEAIIKEVLGFVGDEARHKAVKFHVDIPAGLVPVYADSIQIEQVLLNLVRNAFDALMTLEPDRREIFITVTQGEPDWVTTEIRDTGPGCAPGMRERLFDPFVTSKHEGLGIGLSISQGIIDSHGGKLWLEETTDSGAAFRFTLPRVENHEPAS